MVAFPVLAQTDFVPSPERFAYDAGTLPSVAISGTSVVEVHQGAKWIRIALVSLGQYPGRRNGDLGVQVVSI